MGIKIVQEGGIVKAKGNTLGSNIGYFFAILFFIAGGIMILAGSLGAASILALIGVIIIIVSAHHTKKVRIKKLRELGYSPFEETSKGKAGLIIIFLIIGIIFVLTMWWYSNAYDKQQQLIDLGCIPLTFSNTGIATSWSCP